MSHTQIKAINILLNSTLRQRHQANNTFQFNGYQLQYVHSQPNRLVSRLFILTPAQLLKHTSLTAVHPEGHILIACNLP